VIRNRRREEICVKWRYADLSVCHHRLAGVHRSARGAGAPCERLARAHMPTNKSQAHEVVQCCGRVSACGRAPARDVPAHRFSEQVCASSCTSSMQPLASEEASACEPNRQSHRERERRLPSSCMLAHAVVKIVLFSIQHLPHLDHGTGWPFLSHWIPHH